MQLFKDINATCMMPVSFLEKKWAATAEAVKSAYTLTEDDPTFFPVAMGAFRKVVCSKTSYGDKIAPLFKEAILGEIVDPKPPTAKLMPNGINPDAIPLWQALFKSKRKYIVKYKDNVEKWAAAIVFFKRMCQKKGIEPFSIGHAPSKGVALKPLRTQITKSIDTLNSAHDILIGLGHAKKASKPVTFVRVKRGDQETLVTFRKELSLKAKYNAYDSLMLLQQKMRGSKPGEKRNTFVIKQGQKVTLIFSIKKKAGAEIIVNIVVSVPERILKKIEVLDKPPAFFRKWAKKKFATATVHAEESVSARFAFKEPEDLFRLLSAIDLQFIVESGDSEYQEALVKHLILEARRFGSDCPMSFHEFLDNPDYRSKIQKKFTVTNEDTSDKIIGPGA